jgi:hypothetical protein
MITYAPFRRLDDCELYTLEEFTHLIENGLTDSDGLGFQACENGLSGQQIKISDMPNIEIDETCTRIAWYQHLWRA